jgi:uncharacterized delta-60 repeat protein
VSKTSTLRFPLVLGLMALAFAAFGNGSARAACGEEGSDEIAFQGSGKLLLAACGQGQQAVIQLDRSGQLDPTFAADGSLGPWPSYRTAHLAVTPEGEVLVQMTLGKGKSRRVVLRRFSANGKLDRSFASGNAPVPTGGSSPEQLRVFAQPQGTAVVAYQGSWDGCYGNDCGERTNYLQLFRYSANGKRIGEASYYTEGWSLRSVAMAPNGDLLVSGGNLEYGNATYLRTKPNLKRRAGHKFAEGPFDAGILSVVPAPGGAFLASTYKGIQRYLPDWSTDGTFGDGGFARCESQDTKFGSLESLASGEFLAAGGPGQCGLARFEADGRPDPTFGTDGGVDLEALGLIQSGYRLQTAAVGPEGQIAITFANANKPIVKISRFTADGQLETGFGTNGVVTVNGVQPG